MWGNVKRSIGRIIKLVFEVYFEHQLGVRTAQRKHDAPQSKHGDSAVLQPASYVCLWRLRRHLRAQGIVDGTFVDFGCGSGRVLAFMSALGFNRLVGIELDSEICSVARRNLNRYPKCEVRNIDAANYEFDRSESVLFFFNPFGPATLRELLAKLKGQNVTLVCVNPTSEWLEILAIQAKPAAVELHGWNPDTAVCRTVAV